MAAVAHRGKEVTFSEAGLAALNGMQGGRAGATGKLVQLESSCRSWNHERGSRHCALRGCPQRGCARAKLFVKHPARPIRKAQLLRGLIDAQARRLKQPSLSVPTTRCSQE